MEYKSFKDYLNDRQLREADEMIKVDPATKQAQKKAGEAVAKTLQQTNTDLATAKTDPVTKNRFIGLSPCTSRTAKSAPSPAQTLVRLARAAKRRRCSSPGPVAPAEQPVAAFAMLRSMYVAPNNADVSEVRWQPAGPAWPPRQRGGYRRWRRAASATG